MHARWMVQVGARAILAAFVLVSVAGCDVVVGSLSARAQAEKTWENSYPLAGDGTIEVVNGNGRIEVVGADVETVQVRAIIKAKSSTDEAAREFLQKIEIGEETAAGRLRLETKAPRITGSHAEVQYELTVPATASLRLQNTNGQIHVTGIRGEVQAETTNGGVKGVELAGRVNASTTNGGVDLDMLAVAEGGVRAETTNGGVSVRIPPSAKANLRASCVNGGISISGLTVEGGESTRRRMEGRLNGGGPLVEVETTNGGVRLAARE